MRPSDLIHLRADPRNRAGRRGADESRENGNAQRRNGSAADQKSSDEVAQFSKWPKAYRARRKAANIGWDINRKSHDSVRLPGSGWMKTISAGISAPDRIRAASHAGEEPIAHRRIRTTMRPATIAPGYLRTPRTVRRWWGMMAHAPQYRNM